MKKLILLSALMLMGSAFCDSAELLNDKSEQVSEIVSAYSSYLESILPFNIGFNLTDSNELITLSMGLNGTEIMTGLTNTSLDCKTTSVVLSSVTNISSKDDLTNLLSENTISCYSNEAKGELIVSSINAILGDNYIYLENKGIIGQIIDSIASIFKWFMNLFNSLSQ